MSETPLSLALKARGWTVTYDRRSGEPLFLEGPPIAWDADDGLVPLTAEGKTTATRRKLRLSEIAARELMNDDAVRLDEGWTSAADENGTLLHVTFRRKEPSDARITFVVGHGNLIQVHAEGWRPLEALSPRIAAEEAWMRVAVTGDVAEFSQELKRVALTTNDEPPGVYTGPFGKGYEDHLVWWFRFRLTDDLRTFVAYVDAMDGTLLELFDDDDYAFVSGTIYPRTIAASEVKVPFAHTAVSNGSTVTTDLGGRYDYGGGTASVTLNGSFFNVNDSCGAPSAADSLTGNIDLGPSTGTDCNFSSTGHSTRAARNAHYHLSNVRRLGLKWLNGVNAKAMLWMNTNVGVNVNIASTCNAYWNGSTLNFFRSGSGCANAAEIEDVSQHEWGHGLDENTKSGSPGNEAKKNAVSDAIAMLMTHDQCIGPKFLSSGSGGETAACPDAISDLARVVTPANISTQCNKTFGCVGSLGYECHCEAHILSGAYWKLQQSYVQRYGENEGWNRFEKTFLRALPNVTSYAAGGAGSAYDAWMAADDDNGNIIDGTPNADIVYIAFASQGIAGTQRAANVVQCQTALNPVQPVLSIENGAIALTWPEVSGATYSLFRRLAISGGTPVFLPLAADLSATSYLDSEVAPGSAYEYQVVASAVGCPTPYSDTVLSATADVWPAHLVATAISPSAVEVSWDAEPLAATYAISRSTDGTNFTDLGTQSSTGYLDTGLDPDTTYVYRVAVTGSARDARDLATTVMFTDADLSGIGVKAVHAIQLRTAINAVLAVTNATATYTNLVAAGSPVAAVDVNDMRSAVAFGRSRIPGLPAMPDYSDASIDAGAPIRANHVLELRERVK